MSKDYADQRAAILRNFDGMHYEVDAKKKVGFLWLDRPPLNVVSYRGRSQIAAIVEAFGHDPDVRVVVIRGKNGVYTSGGDVKAFPQIERDGMSHLAWISLRLNVVRSQSSACLKSMQWESGSNWPWPAISASRRRIRS